jgi:hypothetical protein
MVIVLFKEFIKIYAYNILLLESYCIIDN